MKTKFEYVVLSVDGCSNGFNQEKYLNEMGADGWELVGVTCTTHGKPILYLKRELKEKKKKVTYTANDALKEYDRLSKEIKTYDRLAIENIESRMRQIIVDKLGCENSEVTVDASFRDDLGADSLDAVELIMEFEHEFNVMTNDDDTDRVVTVGDAVNLIFKLINER